MICSRCHGSGCIPVLDMDLLIRDGHLSQQDADGYAKLCVGHGVNPWRPCPECIGGIASCCEVADEPEPPEDDK